MNRNFGEDATSVVISNRFFPLIPANVINWHKYGKCSNWEVPCKRNAHCWRQSKLGAYFFTTIYEFNLCDFTHYGLVLITHKPLHFMRDNRAPANIQSFNNKHRQTAGKLMRVNAREPIPNTPAVLKCWFGTFNFKYLNCKLKVMTFLSPSAERKRHNYLELQTYTEASRNTITSVLTKAALTIMKPTSYLCTLANQKIFSGFEQSAEGMSFKPLRSGRKNVALKFEQFHTHICGNIGRM